MSGPRTEAGRALLTRLYRKDPAIVDAAPHPEWPNLSPEYVEGRQRLLGEILAIEQAAAREALPSQEEMARALLAAHMWTDEETHESIARGSVEDVAEGGRRRPAATGRAGAVGVTRPCPSLAHVHRSDDARAVGLVLHRSGLPHTACEEWPHREGATRG